jgi:DNA-binding winged helix-turn-helix (wHTH) protein
MPPSFEASGESRMRVTFDGCVFDSGTRQVLRDGRAAPLSPKAFALLEILIEKRPKAVSKEEIRERLWPATFVAEANLANLVVELRAALGDTAGKQKFIGTVPKFGYAFRAQAKEARRESASRPAPFASRLIWGPREIALDPGENLIGRDRDAVVWIDDESVSRRHARIIIDESGAMLEDLGSKNGTFVKGRKISGLVRPDDEAAIRIGPASMIFRIFKRTGSTASTVGDRARS